MNKVLAIIFATALFLVISFSLTYYVMTAAWGLELKSLGVWIWGTILSVINTVTFQSIVKAIISN